MIRVELLILIRSGHESFLGVSAQGLKDEPKGSGVSGV
jgi:hypothetical protein